MIFKKPVGLDAGIGYNPCNHVEKLFLNIKGIILIQLKLVCDLKQNTFLILSTKVHNVNAFDLNWIFCDQVITESLFEQPLLLLTLQVWVKQQNIKIMVQHGVNTKLGLVVYFT